MDAQGGPRHPRGDTDRVAEDLAAIEARLRSTHDQLERIERERREALDRLETLHSARQAQQARVDAAAERREADSSGG